MAPRREAIRLNLRTYREAVYETLRGWIGELELPPGSRLVEADLAMQFEVSKTPVREALLLLEADGLVKLEPYQGATVTWLSLDEYEELLYMQDALELPALARDHRGHHRDGACGARPVGRPDAAPAR